MLKELTRIVSLLDFQQQLEGKLEEAEDTAREVIAEQLDECRCAVEHAINGHRSNSQVWYNPFAIEADDFSLSLGA